MIRRTFITTGLITLLSLGGIFVRQAMSNHNLIVVRGATARFQMTSAARAAGYELVIGFDYCFQSYGIGGMGYHYLNRDFLDTKVDLLHPEALVYAPDANGSIQLGAIEYMVPAAAWKTEHTELPQLFGQRFHLDERQGMYMLHVWIWKENPAGMFEDWNPDVFCPSLLPWKGPNHWR